MQRFCKEVVTWKTLQHPNVLPLIGVIMSGAQFAMVSDWMANGNINEFLKANSDANGIELVGFSFQISLHPLCSKSTDDRIPGLAERCCQGIDIHP